MLNRTRKAFTLLELMVAFIIMAILSAVAIPSLIGVVANDQATANSTSAVAIADAAYYNAESSDAGVFPLTAASYTPYLSAGDAVVTATSTCVTFSFSSGPNESATVPATESGASPTPGC